MATQTLVTPEQFDALLEEEGPDYELLDGELIEMAVGNKRHCGTMGNFVGELHPFLRLHKLSVAVPELEFEFGADRLRPDLVVLSMEKWARVDPERIPVRGVVPDVALEIMSPSEKVLVLDRKIHVYLASGVLEVWIANPEKQHMYVHTLEGVRFLRSDAVLETPIIPGWSVPVSNFFVAL